MLNHIFYMKKLHTLLSISTCIIFSTFLSTECFAQNKTSRQSLGIEDLVKKLAELPYYNDSVRFVVGMPQLTEDVVYDIELNQLRDNNDTISPCAYLIGWEMPDKDDSPNGFSAYFGGNHFRYSGTRLQEYHWTWDSIPFMSGALRGLNSEPIHKAAQFADLLPAMVSEKIRKMEGDSAYSIKFIPDTIISGNQSIVISAILNINGIIGSEQEYIFDAASLLPTRFHFENSPGSISEQTVDVYYKNARTTDKKIGDLSEEYLMSLYPDIFANFRESNFRIENLPGTKLPSFALPALSGDRYAFHRNDTFKNPVILALIDPDGGFNNDYIAALRQAAASLPFQTEIIWAFSGTNPDRIEEQINGNREGETTLLSARGLIRDCGVSSLPVTIMVDRSGTVRNIILGYTPTLSSDIIQNMALIND